MDTNALALSEEATLRRYNAQQDRVANDFGFADTKGALGITRDCLKVLTEAVQEVINTYTDLPRERGKPTEENLLYAVLHKLPAEKIALATLSSMLNVVAQDGLFTSVYEATGKTLQAECFAAGLLEHDARTAAQITRAVKRKHGALRYRKQAARSLAKRAGYNAEKWSRTQLVKAGGILVDTALSILPHVFVHEEVPGFGDALSITEGALKMAEHAVESSLRRSPVFLPCTDAPAPWTGYSTGGYWNDRTRLQRTLIRTFYKETAGTVRAAMSTGAMQPHVDAVNALQSVAWKINERVLGVVKWAYENDIPVKGLPPLTNVEMPPKPADMDTNEDARKLWRNKAAKTKQYNRSFVSNRILMKQDMETADLMSEAGKFWTPMNCDWRGRIYSIPHFNFQRDDRVRALFLFADGEPIGEEGLYWLKVHVANCGDFGKVSKQPIAERVKWVNDNLERIEQMTLVPTKDTWWKEADKPFLFLAACMELTSALAAGSSYTTCLPISFDGSCSGLQHLSAMTRDERTAKLVNLLPGETPQDVYQTVADAVSAAIASQGGTGLSKLWLDYGITRKLVKRNVMTYSYGSKKFGMAAQYMEDLMRPLDYDVLAGKLAMHPFATPEDTVTNKDGTERHRGNGYAAAKYLSAIVFDTIEGLVTRPAQAMTMLQKCARALAHEGKPMTWATPLGLPWVNRYHVFNMEVLDLWLHDTRLQMKCADGYTAEIDKEKSANGAAPNFVHALDAAHLLMTANACVSEHLTQLATVHDSFGCLASRAARFRQIIREQFVALYTNNDVLAQVLASSSHDLTVHNQQRLPEVPAMGGLNLMEVLDADYAFA